MRGCERGMLWKHDDVATPRCVIRMPSSAQMPGESGAKGRGLGRGLEGVKRLRTDMAVSLRVVRMLI